MRQKKTLLILALFLFVLFLTKAYSDDFYWVQFNSFHNVYDPSYFSVPEDKYVQAAAGTQSNSSHVFVQFNNKSPLQYDPSKPNNSLTYLPQWSALLPPYNIYTRNFLPNFPYFESNNAVFFIDTNNNSAYDSNINEPLSFIPSRPGTYSFLDVASNVKITGGIYPTITWDPVARADNYRVEIVGFNPDGTPNIADLQFIVKGLTSTSYMYSGSPLQYGQSYAFIVEARDSLNDTDVPGTLVNQSRYLTEYTPVPEPATMLLLGSGLIGLAGYARKRFKK